MPTRASLWLLLLLFMGACGGGARATRRQGQDASTRIIAATVEKNFTFRLGDSKPGSQVELGPEPNGLKIVKGFISGTPQRAMVMHAIARQPGLTSADTTWIIVFASPLDAPQLPAQLHQYRGASLDIPRHLSPLGGRGLGASPEGQALTANPATDAGVTLGRVLFYDQRLSANDAVSCASCHLQSVGFADTARLSRGHNGQETRRRSMALANVRFTGGRGFFWDQRAKSLEQQVLMPIQDTIEMGMKLPDLERKLRLIPYYPALFDAAFGSPEITVERTARALAQFLRALVSADSPFDRQFAAPNGVGEVTGLTLQEREGFDLFRRNGCAVCHVTSSQIVLAAMNSGLDAEPADSGAGRGAFRAPSLRNVAVRPPYMHDGRFKSLDDVLDFYNAGVQANPNLDSRLRDRGTQGPRRLNLTDDERAALKAFLHSLTDSTFLAAPEFSDPFIREPLRKRSE